MSNVSQLSKAILHQVTCLKVQLSSDAYRHLCQCLSSQLEYEVNECDFGHLPEGPLDPRTGHPRGCWCKECFTELMNH